MGFFDGKVAWITGASRGIGRETAKEFYREGAYIIASARTKAKLQSLKEEVPQSDRIRVLPVDLMDEEQIERAVTKARDWKSQIDILVNNAGITQRGKALDTEMSAVRRLMEVNFFAAVHLTRTVAPKMVERGEGYLTAIASLAGHVATPTRSTYSATKAAIRSYYQSLWAELHDTGVSATVVSPGYVATEISKNAVIEDGSALGEMDDVHQGAIPPEKCARKIVKATAKGKREKLIGRWEKLGVYLNRYFPIVGDWILPHMKPE